MNFEFFISKRLSTSKEQKSLSNIFIKIATIASALSLIVMIFTVSILDGFKSTITSKLSGFSAHILITKHESNFSYESSPIYKNDKIINELKSIKGVTHVQSFVAKTGLVKSKTETFGVILKGVGEDYNWSFLKNNLVKGRLLKVSNGKKTSKEVVISKELADKLQVDTGQSIFLYFISDKTLLRKYKIVGIYNTGMTEFDKLYIFADIHDLQKLNNWNYIDNQQISGYEVFISNFKNLDRIYNEIYHKIGFKFDANGEKLLVRTIKELYPVIFDWLSLLDKNALVLLVIMIIISSINMITALLILILERTRMIGILKALGASNNTISKIMIFNGLHILLKGLFYGNIIAIGTAFLQNKFHLIRLNPSVYYMSYVPFELNISKILIINIAMVAITFAILILPSMIITKIDPVKAIKFD